MTGTPDIFMPEAEVLHLREAYGNANIILEYGSGGSTELAASLPGKLVFSVESDRKWANELRAKIARTSPEALVTVHHVDIGPTGPWGRPLDEKSWRQYHSYPNEIWDKPYFRHPDLVLIDGRCRTACLVSVMLHAQKPVRVLFDDYTIRPLYHAVERFIRPVQLIGRMAEFQVEPKPINPEHIGLMIEQFFKVSIHGMGEEGYRLPQNEIHKIKAV